MSALEDAAAKPHSRKRFLTSGLVGGALLLGIDVAVSNRRAQAAGSGGQVTVYVRINPDETVTIIAPNSEMGQGTSSALPQIVAEELMVDWSKVRMEFASVMRHIRENKVYVSFATGGSRASIVAVALPAPSEAWKNPPRHSPCSIWLSTPS